MTPSRGDDGVHEGAILRAGNAGYRIERKIGQGGAGAVFQAAEVTSGQRVALKVLRRELVSDAAMSARFEREARALGEIRHPGIVEVLDAGRLDDGRPYLALSLLEGVSLRGCLEERRQLSPEEAWTIARDVATATLAAHDAGIVHRDLKPENIFLEGGAEGPPRVRVLDFGIAKVAADPSAGEDPMRLTTTGAPLGTPTYMAPEQWWAAGVGPATDQYALGVVLFETIAGRPPFESSAFPELVQLHVSEPAPSLLARGVTVSDEIEAFIARLLAKEPGDRFASMRDLLDAGDRAFGAQAIEPTVTRVTPALRRIVAPPTSEAAELAQRFTGARALQRYFSIHGAILALGLAGVVAVGYGGSSSHDVIEWTRAGGWSVGIIVLYIPFAAYALAQIARARAETGGASRAGFWFALAPALQGTFGAIASWRAVLQEIPPGAEGDELRYFSVHAYETNVGRYLGFSVSALLFLSLSAMSGLSGMTHATATLPRSRGFESKRATAWALTFAVGAVAADVLGRTSSAALILATVAIGIGARAAIPTLHVTSATRDEIERRAAFALGLLFAAAAAMTRLDAERASLWAEVSTRAERVARILATARDRAGTLEIGLAVVAVFALLDGATVFFLPGRERHVRPRRPAASTLAFLATVLAGGVLDLGQRARATDETGQLLGSLTSQFASFTRLDPPPGDALEDQGFVAHRALGLQVTRDAIAVEGRGVATLAALDSKDGVDHVNADLNRALATATLARKAGAGVELSVSVDREVDAGTVARLLGIAYRAGVRRAELLLTRGASPDLASDGPPELSVVLPQDFVALPIELGARGRMLNSGKPFSEVARALVVEALAAHGPIAIAVPE